MARLFFTTSATWAVWVASVALPAFASTEPFRVVIDPGHGGIDEGTVFNNGRIRVAEKDVTLSIAQEAARQLKRHGFEVTLTRVRDKELPVPSRTALANKLRADVFISIHMNSPAHGTVSTAHSNNVAMKEPEGIETYILNNASDATSKRLAQLENSVIGGAPTLKDVSDAAGQTDVALILQDLRLDANLSESKRLACAIQSNLVKATAPKESSASRVRDRGVKQALFYVLLGADMPSVLVEAGFLTHPRDRLTVLTPQGRSSIASALVKSLKQFRLDKDTRRGLVALSKCKVH